MDKVNIVVIGAGAVGLAVACELSKSHKDIFVLERNPSFGQETSSRNSEVIHAGIYYPQDSLKARTCLDGNRLIYEFCRKHNIPHKKIGKLIVATDDREVTELEKLFKNGVENGISDLKMLTRDDAKKIEPNVIAKAAIYSPSTGIIDSHAYMKALVSEFEARGGGIAYNTVVVGINKVGGSYVVRVKDASGDELSLETRIVINCAGLDSDKVARMAGLNDENYKIKLSKGDYFRVHNGKAKFLNGLVYPVPGSKEGGLGIHATLDTGGGLKLGPDHSYVDHIDYSVDEKKADMFFSGVRKYLPFIELADLRPDTSGIRPKLQGPGEDVRDFIIQDEAARGLAGFINLVGIESPGLTASLSIAKVVQGKI